MTAKFYPAFLFPLGIFEIYLDQPIGCYAELKKKNDV